MPEYKDAEIVRSRNPADLEPCDIVVDVGAVFDPERQRFDHHQREFTETMKSLKILDYDTKLSSAGLVYAYYGKAVISAITGIPKESQDMAVLYEKVRSESSIVEVIVLFLIFGANTARRRLRTKTTGHKT